VLSVDTTGLATIAGGFISQASSTVTGGLTVDSATTTNATTTTLNIETSSTLDNWLYWGGTPLLSASSTAFNTFLGLGAGTSTVGNALDEGVYNSAVGYQALQANTTGGWNTAVGPQVLFSNTTGGSNTAIGHQALFFNTIGDQNSAFGDSALYTNSVGTENSAFGRLALGASTIGVGNSAFGSSALADSVTGSYNVALGFEAGNNLTEGDNNLIIGGNSIDFASSTASNQLNIGNLIYGIDLDGTGTTISSGNIGIGTTSPKQRLEVNGNIQIHEQNSSVAGLMITQAGGETGYIMHNRASTLTIGAGSVDRITIDRDGNVGFGVTRPANPIQLASGAHVTAGGVWTNSSSRARKENIADLSASDALDALDALEPVQFNYKNDQTESYIGFIAEDVPELVATRDRDGLSAMDIVAVLTKVVQEQQKKIAELEARLDQR